MDDIKQIPSSKKMHVYTVIRRMWKRKAKCRKAIIREPPTFPSWMTAHVIESNLPPVLAPSF